MAWKVVKRWKGKTPNGRPYIAYELRNGQTGWALASAPEGTSNFFIQDFLGKLTHDKKMRILRAIERYEKRGVNNE